jgi:heterodisulfide reductase subunit A
VQESRRVVLDLLLARCPDTPLVQQLAREYGIEHTSYAVNPEPTDCVLCGLCARVCDLVGACPFGNVLWDEGAHLAEKCDLCGGQPWCVKFCPTGAITFRSFDSRACRILSDRV